MTCRTSLLSDPPRRILLCQLRQIGDVLLATPCAALLARCFPDAEIHFLTESKCAPVLENNPHIHTVWSLDKSRLKNLLQELLWYKKVASTGFDLVVDFQQLPRIRWVVGLSGARVRLGAAGRWYNRWLYTHFSPSSPPGLYAAAVKAKVLEPIGIYWNGERPELFLTQEERSQAASLFHRLGVENAPIISVDVTHRRMTRRWPARYYAALLDGAAKAFPAARFFLPYGPGEKEDILEVRSLSRCPERFAIPEEVISLRLLAASIERCTVHLGNCSAPRHMAVALGVPTFTLLGATSPGWTYPSPEHAYMAAGLACQPCNRNSCDIGYRCLQELGPDRVLPSFIEHLRLFGGFASEVLPEVR